MAYSYHTLDMPSCSICPFFLLGNNLLFTTNENQYKKLHCILSNPLHRKCQIVGVEGYIDFWVKCSSHLLSKFLYADWLVDPAA